MFNAKPKLDALASDFSHLFSLTLSLKECMQGCSFMKATGVCHLSHISSWLPLGIKVKVLPLTIPCLPSKLDCLCIHSGKRPWRSVLRVARYITLGRES